MYQPKANQSAGFGTVTRTGIQWGVASPDAGQQAQTQQAPAQPAQSGNQKWEQYRRAMSGELGVGSTTTASRGGSSNSGASSFQQAVSQGQARQKKYNRAVTDYQNDTAAIEADRKRRRTGVIVNREKQFADVDAAYVGNQADIDVWEADQAIADGKARAGRDVAVLTNNQRRAVGGGSFSRAASGRGRTVLGGSITGGLDAVNRQNAKKARVQANDAKAWAQKGAVWRQANADEWGINETADIDTTSRPAPWNQVGFYDE